MMFFQILRAFWNASHRHRSRRTDVGLSGVRRPNLAIPAALGRLSFTKRSFAREFASRSGQRGEDGMRPLCAMAESIRSLSVNAYDSPALGSVEAWVLPRNPASGQPRTRLLLGRICSAGHKGGPRSFLRNWFR